MKKNTSKLLLLSTALVLMIAVFVLSFFVNIKQTQSGNVGIYVNTLWGCNYLRIEGVGEVTIKTITSGAVDNTGLNIVPFIGLLLMVVTTLLALLVGLMAKDAKKLKIYLIVLAVLVLAGAIMQFFPISTFVTTYYTKYGHATGMTDAQIKEAIKNYIDEYHDSCTAPVAYIMGALGCLASLTIGGTALISKK